MVMNSDQAVTETKLDLEWLQLILEAKKAGLTITEIRNFLSTETAHIQTEEKR